MVVAFPIYLTSYLTLCTRSGGEREGGPRVLVRSSCQACLRLKQDSSRQGGHSSLPRPSILRGRRSPVRSDEAVHSME